MPILDSRMAAELLSMESLTTIWSPEDGPSKQPHDDQWPWTVSRVPPPRRPG